MLSAISVPLERGVWMRVRSKHWWVHIINATFTDTDWVFFQMRNSYFEGLHSNLHEHLQYRFPKGAVPTSMKSDHNASQATSGCGLADGLSDV